jgi:hypothetical protein
MDALTKLGKMFIDISLGYVDECCLGYTFYNDKQNAYKSAADGVVIYAQNWKTLLKNAAITMFVVLLVLIIVTVSSMLLFAAGFRLCGLATEWSGIAGFVLGLLTAFAIKYAFVDTWIMVKMMSTYLEVAPSTKITFDLYGKFCNMSPKFGQLMKKADIEPSPVIEADSSFADDRPSPNFCPQCGQSLAPDAKFCAQCGNKIY